MCDNSSVILKRFRELMDNSGKSRQEIAKEFGCDASTITKHYNGDRGLTTDQLIKYAKLFNVSADYMLGLASDATTDKDKAYICDYTGLSSTAVDYLHKIKPYSKAALSCSAVAEVLNFLLSDKSIAFEDFCNLFLEHSTKTMELYLIGSLSTDDSDIRIDKKERLYHYRQEVKRGEIEYIIKALDLIREYTEKNTPDSHKAKTISPSVAYIASAIPKSEFVDLSDDEFDRMKQELEIYDLFSDRKDVNPDGNH